MGYIKEKGRSKKTWVDYMMSFVLGFLVLAIVWKVTSMIISSGVAL